MRVTHDRFKVGGDGHGIQAATYRKKTHSNQKVVESQ